jgi:ribosomal protein S18 acetylase RimI-like enzyme
VTCTDWRDASDADVSRLYAAEGERWQRELAWDPAAVFATVEQGRTGGHVAGWIARDDEGRVAGWTFYLLHDGTLQIGGLVASRPSVARRLLDAILDSPEAAVARGLSCFLFPDASGVSSALVRQRFALRNTVYLHRDLPASGGAAARRSEQIRPWTMQDLAATVRVLESAYTRVPGAACFAPDGRREQWAHYTWQLLRTPGCGRFDAALSCVVTSPGSSIPAGVALVTWIAPDAVHLAQIAVAEDHRRRGLGGELLESAMASAVAAGANQMTLMVDAENAAALALYRRFGFTERARMIYGSRAARTRVAA